MIDVSRVHELRASLVSRLSAAGVGSETRRPPPRAPLPPGFYDVCAALARDPRDDAAFGRQGQGGAGVVSAPLASTVMES